MTDEPLTLEWRETAEAIDLESLGAHDPFERLESWLRPKLREFLLDRARELSQEELVRGCLEGKFGRYARVFSDLIQEPQRWGYRDHDEDAKALTRALKRKGAAAMSVVAPVLEAARVRFDVQVEGVPPPSPLHRTHKTRVKLLSLAVDGEIDVPPAARLLFSPLPAAPTRALAAAGPLPIVPLRVKEKVDFTELTSDKSKSAVPSYPQRWMVAWSSSCAASYSDAAGTDPIAPIVDYVLVNSRPWTVWGYLARRHTYLAVNATGDILRLVPHAKSLLRSQRSSDVSTIVPRVAKRIPPAIPLRAWASKSPAEVRDALLAGLPQAVRKACHLDMSVLVELYSNGGRIDENGGLALANASIRTRAATYDLSSAPRMYNDVRDAPPGAYHQIAYSESLQASLCIHAEDTSGDPVVYEIDHENWLRGQSGTLRSLLALTLERRS